MDRTTDTTPGTSRKVYGDTRRDILTAAGFTGLAAIAAIGFVQPDTLAQSTPVPSPDAHLISMCSQLDRLESSYNAIFDEDWEAAMAQLDAITVAQLPLLHRICATPARTLAGVQAKARSLFLWADDVLGDPGNGDPVRSLTASVLRDLVGGVS